MAFTNNDTYLMALRIRQAKYEWLATKKKTFFCVCFMCKNLETSNKLSYKKYQIYKMQMMGDFYNKN